MANFGIDCALPPACEKQLEVAVDSATPIFLSLDNGGSEVVPPSTPIMWNAAVEDDSGMYNSTTGIITIPQDGIWQMHARVLVNEGSMMNFPATFFQHILIIDKSQPFPDGSNIRFINLLQENFSTVAPPMVIAKQVTLQGTETIRLTAGDQFSIQIITVTFSPVFGIVDTVISGVGRH